MSRIARELRTTGRGGGEEEKVTAAETNKRQLYPEPEGLYTAAGNGDG